MILVVLILILAILLFGPFAVMLGSLIVAIGAGVVGTAVLILFGLFAFVVACTAGAWMIWYVFDPPGAMESYRAAERRRDARAERQWPK
jgi:hypothetical protein